MPARNYKSEDLRNLLYDDGPDNLTVLQNKQHASGRWSSHHYLVFLDATDNTMWGVSYSQGLTEYQDEQPFDHADEQVCHQVEPYQVTITKYREIK